MSRGVGFVVDNNFSKGLVTEFSGLNFPENACTESLNCIFDKNGAVFRRAGFNLETNYIKTTAPTDLVDSSLYQTYYWKNAANSGVDSFVVLQIGNKLNFFRPDTTNNTVSTGLQVFSVDLATYAIAGAPSLYTAQCSFTEGNGYLFVAHPYCDTFAVKYDSGTNTFTVVTFNIKIRDFKGVPDSLAVTETTRPLTIDNFHRYNLYNQGWDSTLVTTWFTALANYPSNSDIWWFYKDASDVFTPSTAKAVTNKNETTSTVAPKGSIILNVFNQDRNTATGLTGLTAVTSSYFRPSTVAFYAGRVFYSGVSYSGYANEIYFSQIIQGEGEFGKCYQANDPSSENQADLLSADGGVIKIIEAGNILYMLPVRTALMVFATNGVWTISGSTGVGFSANDYTVDKISEIGCISQSSFVSAAGIPFWWNEDGIYTVQAEQGGASVTAVTQDTIKSFYQAIPFASKKKAVGAFSLNNREVIWIYYDTDTTKTKFLNLRLQNLAFAPWQVQVTAGSIKSVFAIEGSQSSNAPYQLNSSFKYLVAYNSTDQYTFGQFDSTTYTDWAAETPYSYPSYFVSGYRVRGDAIRRFQSDYIQVFYDMSKEPTGKAYITGLWDYATSTASGRFTNQQTVYRNTPTGRKYNFSKLKIRGSGTSLQLKFEADGNYPFYIVGWSSAESVNSKV